MKKQRRNEPRPLCSKASFFDSKGHRLQPTHSSKHERKYRYYVSAPLIRNAKTFPDGLRVPASDLEKIVINSIAAKLRDESWVTTTFFEPDKASELRPMIDRAISLAKRVEQQTVLNDCTFRTIIHRVEVSKNIISIKLGFNSIAAALLPNADAEHPAAAKNSTVEILIRGQFLRCGKQVRLVLGNDDAVQRNPDDRLIQEVVRAQRWFDDLSNGRATSIAALAKRERCSAPYISLKISLAFLAPDIVQSIIDGKQPQTLTPERLKKACPLPISWEEQRAVLLA